MVNDEHFMKLALEQAQRAAALGEAPVGAVLVCDGQVVSTGYNTRELDQDPTAHAELLVLREGARQLRRWRLTGCTLYVTLEPCLMCAGAMLLARIDRLVYGAVDPKAGAADSLYHVLQDERLNHRIKATAGVLAAECGEILTEFFRSRRAG